MSEIKRHMDERDYHAHPAMSKSKLWPISKTAAHFAQNMEAPSEPTRQMQLGTLVHTLVLEPDLFVARYVVDDFVLPAGITMRHNAGKELRAEWIDACGDREIIDTDTYDLACAMAARVLAHPTVGKPIVDAEHELSIFWEDSETALPCRARVDAYHKDLRVAFDLKTGADASPAGFRNAVARYGYHIQDAHYTAGLQDVGLLARDVPLVFVVVESAPPHEVATYQLNPSARDLGYDLYRDYIRRAEEALRRNEYPGYSTDVVELDLPRWLYVEHNR